MAIVLEPVHPAAVCEVTVYVVLAVGQALGLKILVELRPVAGNQAQVEAAGILVAVN
jgi:hypothetical protein